ncbi:MAG: hypothetical protein J1G02_05065 [Clostridiales bacterium]|nr:hypothetical protein [Clostridiales bacterium]
MPKYKIVCLLLAVLVAATGTVLVITNLTGSDIPTFEKYDEDPNTYLDRTEDMDIDNPIDNDIISFLFVAHKKLLMTEGFYGESNGSSTAVGVKQNVRNTRYVVGAFDNKSVLKEMVTKGVVSKAYQLYMVEDNYIYRKGLKVNALDSITWANTAQALSEDAFYNDFGHRNDKLVGYILNWDTVTKGEFVEKADGVYTFRYTLDPDTSTTFLRREMIFNGNLNSEPSFNKCVIYVSMDADFNIKSLRTDCEYKAHTMGINATCTEDITEVFKPYEGDLPEKDFFEQYFTSTPSGGIEKEITALDVLLEMFSPYLNGEDLQVAVAASSDGNSIVNGLLSIEGLNIEDLSKLTVNANIGNLDLAYVHGEGAIYLKYKDFKASTTVNGVMGLMSTLAPLLSGDAPSGVALDGIDLDLEALLDNLTYSITGNKVVVSLPVALGGINIDAKLYGVVDGENYTFSSAVIDIDGVSIELAPSKWTVAKRSGDYPEILGLMDILQNGKLALNADLTVGDYLVSADALVDLATGNLQVNAQIDNNGTVNVAYVDGVAYITLGEVKVKFDTEHADELLEMISKYTGIQLATSVPSINLPTQYLLYLLDSIATFTTSDGVDFNINFMGIDATLHLVTDDGCWQIGGITVVMDGVSLIVAPNDAFGEVTAPAKDEYADITELVETFAGPIADIVHGNIYGANISAHLTLNGKEYSVVGNVHVDLSKTVYVNLTLYDGNLGVLDAEVIYADGTVYLTLNGVKVAFAVGGSDSDVDIVAKLSELLNNQQIKEILDSSEELQQLIKQVETVIGTVTADIDLSLLDADFTKLVRAFHFENRVLSVSLDGSVLGLDGLELDITLANVDGCLAVTISGLNVAGATLSASATLINKAEPIAIPDTDEYMLTLTGELLNAEVQVTLDLVHMDIWANVKCGSEIVLVRYLDGKVYIQYGGAKVVVDVTELDKLVAKINNLVGELPNSDSVDLANATEAIVAIGSKLFGQLPDVANNVDVAINFNNVDNILLFDNIRITVSHNGKQYVATISTQEAKAAQLDIAQQFVDANAVIDAVIDTIVAFRDNTGIALDASFKLTLNGVAYDVELNLAVNGGLYVEAVFKYNNKAVLNAEIYLVDGVVYCDVNGIRQAVKLPEASGDMDVMAMIGALSQMDGVQDILSQLGVQDIIAQLGSSDGIVEVLLASLKDIAKGLDGVVISQIIEDMTYADGELTVSLDLAQVNLGNVNVTLGMGNSIAIKLDASTTYVSMQLNATLLSSTDAVTAPESDSYVTELFVAIGEDVTANVKLDMYHNTIVGRAQVYGQTINFKYDGGVVYATYGNVNVKFHIEDIDDLLNAVSRFVELPSLNVGDSDNLAETLMGVISKCSVQTRFNGESYTLELCYDGISATVNFAGDANKVTLDNIQVSMGNLTVMATQVYNQTYPVLPVGGYVDIAELAKIYAEPVANVVYANGYDIGFNGSVGFGGREFGLNASLQINGSNVHVVFSLTYQGVSMIKDGELWLVDQVMYLQVGGLRVAVPVDTNKAVNSQNTQTSIWDSITGYNVYVDKLVELVQSIMNKPLDEIEFDKILTYATLSNGVLTLDVDGSQFDLSSFVVELNGKNGLGVSVRGLQYKDIKVNITNANIVAYDKDITAPTEDFSTNVKVVIDENNSLYANLNLFDNIIKMKLVSKTTNGRPATLDLLYSINDNMLKITDGNELHVSVDINSIAKIVTEINELVNELAGADVNKPLPGMDNMGDVNLKDIIRSLSLTKNGNVVSVGLVALGMNVTANFSSGALKKVTVPFTDDITLNVEPTNENIKYRDFPEDEQGYVRIDKVFDDYYYGNEDNKLNDDPHGPIYDLITTNSWKFDFTESSIITVTNEDGTTTKYQIEAGSFFVFYYNKTALEDTKLRAKLTINKMEQGEDTWSEFIILDAAYIDGRIYASYDSNTKDTATSSWGQTKYSNSNVLRATVSVESIKECMSLVDKLVEVLQLESVMDDLSNSLNQAQGSLTLGNLAAMFKYIGYADNVFTMSLNSNIIDGLGEIELSVKGEGSTLTLNQLTLDFDNRISVNLAGIQVSASAPSNDEYGYEYVGSYIMGYFADENSTILKDGGKSTETGKYDPATDHGYDMSNHMNFDSLYELMSALLVTAGETDEFGQRSFWVHDRTDYGLTVNINLVSLVTCTLNIKLTMYADIDANGDSYFAVKLTRYRTQARILLVNTDVYADRGGNSYILVNTRTGMVTLIRDSKDVHSEYTLQDTTVKRCSICGQDAEEKGIFNKTWQCPDHGAGPHVVDVPIKKEKVTTKSINGYESVAMGAPGYIKTVTSQEFLAHIAADEYGNPGYLFKLLNLTDRVESMIVDAVNKPNDNVYGIEDVFKNYNYSVKDQQFTIQADLSPISSALGTFDLYINHNDDFLLTNLSGDLPIASNIVKIHLDLLHERPMSGDKLAFGYAQHYFVDSEGKRDDNAYMAIWTEWFGDTLQWSPAN